jgi:hypothetical protein
MDLVPSAEWNPITRHKSVERVYTLEQSGAAVSESLPEARIELQVLLPQITTEELRQHGALRGISGSTLASRLLVTIARDDLYDALLDDASSRSGRASMSLIGRKDRECPCDSAPIALLWRTLAR